MNVELVDEAKSEAWIILEHYRAIRTGLENRFSEELTWTLRRIAAHPKLYPADGNGCRRLNLKSFPYYVAYVIVEDAAWVLAVAHARRKPRYWARRLKGV